ncbi:MAG TPA: hypothetical protein VG365_12150 [Solirubrobacteraceae bacterium]|nr:hypothetical protein [Solirubrobacteraceae bacterium]
MSIYLGPTGTVGTQTIRGVLYADAGGEPGALLGVSDQLALQAGTGGWYTLTFPTSVQLTGSLPYWIGARSGPGNAVARYFAICGIQAARGSPANTLAPAIEDITAPGAWAVGDGLTAGGGAWNPAALAYSYQWQSCDATGANCTDIRGATANTYIIGSNRLASTFRVVVRASNARGSRSASSSVSGAGPRTVGRTPSGPPTPRGGWSLVYADAFGAPLGTGARRDNTVWPSRFVGDCRNNAGFNSNEMEVFNCSKARVDSNGLELTCTYAPHIVTGKNYNCGAINTVGPASMRIPSGYTFFHFRPGHGQAWAIQITAKFPPNTGEADPGWWLTDPRWKWEIDMFEGFGGDAGSGGSWCHATSGNRWIGVTDPTWIYHTEPHASIGGDQMLCREAQPSPFDPSAGYHTYTTVIFPNNTMSEYIDGARQIWDYVPNGGGSYRNGGALIGPAGAPADAFGGLIISYSLRDTATGNPDPHFTSGIRSLSVRSIAVYENATADRANTVHPGLVAPGTILVH